MVTGMRRVGKTTLLRQIFDDLETDNRLFLDMENPVNQKYFEEENYEAIKYQLEKLGVDASRRPFVFLDEIQMVKNAPSVVKYLVDHYKWKFFLTGSSSFYLKNLFSESLAGRKIIFELNPLDFEEFLLLKGSSLKIPVIVTEAIYSTIIPLYREYLEYGGFPGVVAKGSFDEKREALAEIFTTYYEKEVLGIGGFKNNQTVRDLILLLCGRVGSKIDVSKLAAELGTSRVTINEYLAFLEGTYLVYFVSPFSSSSDVEIRGAKKLYLCDSGLINHLGKVSMGNVFENLVYSQLKARGGVKYYQRKSGTEIDFVVNEKEAWEVKWKASSRDVARIENLANELGIKMGGVVSFEYVGEEIEGVRYGFQL